MRQDERQSDPAVPARPVKERRLVDLEIFPKTCNVSVIVGAEIQENVGRHLIGGEQECRRK